jgi:hypothetical protein
VALRVIINAGRRRLVSYRYGWRIEILHAHGKTGAQKWIEDPPAYPSSLACACEELFERALKESQDCEIFELSAVLKQTARDVREMFAESRNLL